MTRRSIFQIGSIEPVQTRSGKGYRIRYRVPMGNGRYKQKKETLYGLSGIKEARAILFDRTQKIPGQNPAASDLTFRSFMENYWKPYMDRKQGKPSTMKGYQSSLNKHILPVFGDLTLSEITPIHIEELVQSKQKAGYSLRTMRNIIVLLNTIFHLAEDDDLITKSPVRKSHKPICRKKEKPIWTGDQVRMILDSVPENYRCLFTCVALTGVRLGELLALQWKHVDLRSNKLRIEQSLWQKQIVSPKSASGVRTIPFGDILASVFMAHSRISIFKRPDDFVFCRPDGKWLNPDVLRKDVLYPTLDRLNIPRSKGESGFHAFRHTVGSFVNDKTGNMKLAQTLLGHKDINTTANIYTHTTEEAERKASIAVERAVYENLCPIVPDMEIGHKNTVN